MAPVCTRPEYRFTKLSCPATRTLMSYQPKLRSVSTVTVALPPGESVLFCAAFLWALSRMTADVTGARLLTTDHDFDYLDPAFLTCDWIDPEQHR